MSENSQKVIDDILKKYGDGIAVYARKVVDTPRQIINVSPAIDIALGGGIPEGSVCVFASPPKLGKSTLALHIAAKAQKMPKVLGSTETKNVYYFDIEGRIKKRDLEGIHGLDIDKLYIIHSTQEKILTSEDNLQIARELIKSDIGCVIIMDSIAQLTSEKEMISDTGSTERNNISIILGKFFRQICNTVPVNNTILIAITHLIANTSGYGSPWSESGGNKIKYACDVKLVGKNKELWKASATDEIPIGQKAVWEAQYTALSCTARKATSYLRYGYGIDETRELIDIGESLGLIGKKGAWYEYKDIKAQGAEKLCTALNENSAQYEDLVSSIKAMTE